MVRYAQQVLRLSELPDSRWWWRLTRHRVEGIDQIVFHFRKTPYLVGPEGLQGGGLLGLNLAQPIGDTRTGRLQPIDSAFERCRGVLVDQQIIQVAAPQQCR